MDAGACFLFAAVQPIIRGIRGVKRHRKVLMGGSPNSSGLFDW